MTIQEVIKMLQDEKKHPVKMRYHCRAIMVRTIAQYSRLLEALKGLDDIHVFSTDELFSGPDVMPGYERLMSEAYQDQWVLLPGVSEYLRLFHADEERAQRFGSLWHHQWDADTTGRILIPLWGCETLWYDSALGLCTDERQEGHVYNCCEGDELQRLSIQVLSAEFEPFMAALERSHGRASLGLKEWYGFWYAPNPNITDHLLLTKRFKAIKPTDGVIRIHVVSDRLSFIRENLVGGKVLCLDNCPKEAQEVLFPHALKGAALDDAILKALNAQAFQPENVMGTWSAKTEGEKQLVFLWYALHPDDSYLCHCVGLAKDISELSERILTAVFPARLSHPEWVAVSQALIEAAHIERNDAYFAALDEIPALEDRLDYLTDGTARERVYILRLIGQWLKLEPEAVMRSEKLRGCYPALAAYLSDRYPDEALGRYFGKYKMYKLSNTLPADEESYFAGFDTERYENRYAVLSEELADGESYILWIDALGAEWLPLLAWALEKDGAGKLSSVRVVQALLPSETEFNDLWMHMDVPYGKRDKLDKLAHKGVIDDKDHYACVEEQLRTVSGVVHIVNGLLKQYARVLITGDHGTSRLAARFFHKRDALPLPAHAVAGNHGRYCRLENGGSPMMATQKAASDPDGNHYLVFSNYDHYSKSGFAAGADDETPIYGEIHGGASPEEMLVPVFTVDSLHGIPLSAEWGITGNSVKIQNKRAKCRVRFSRPVSAVQASAGAYHAECAASATPSRDWTLIFSGMKISKATQFPVSLLADGTLVPIEPLEVKPALGGDDPF